MQLHIKLQVSYLTSSKLSPVICPTRPKLSIPCSVTGEPDSNSAFSYFQFISNFSVTRHLTSGRSTLLVGQEQGHPACKACSTNSKGSLFEVAAYAAVNLVN